MKKINQSYSFCDDQLNFLRKVFNPDIRIVDMDKKEVEDKFFKRFSIKRSFEALCVKARREGIRNKKNRLIVGVSTKKGRGGDSDRVLYQLNPPRYMPIPRYVYEKHYGLKLTSGDVIIHLDRDVDNNDISNLKRISRSDLLFMNKIDSLAPVETRALIAELEGKSNNLQGRGVWTDEEVSWLRSISVPARAPRGYWLVLARKFNEKFKKSRSNRDLIAKHASLMRGMEASNEQGND